MNIDIKLLNDLAKIPSRGSDQAAGWDLYAATDKDTLISAHETVKIGTGIAIAIPESNFGALYARSGLATKKGLRPANCCGIIDSDYRGEVIVALHNDTNEPQTVAAGDRIAQLIIQPYEKVDFKVVDELNNTDRGDGGFGSTGN